jgi:sterol desaturase/sphingolipid hydroxylase (fatty acid hydroxylase superfamily)
MEYVFYFLLWTFIIYWIHRLGHNIPVLRKFHLEHHKFIRNNQPTWHWNNIFLFNDNWPSTIDYWLTEVIPTAIFVLITEQWWIGIGFYLYAALIQERLEHNRTFNLYPLYTSGQWHMLHHTSYPCNFGIITPLWDILFKTSKSA